MTPAAANGYHYEVALDESLYRIPFDDLLGQRRGYDATPTTTGILDHRPTLLRHFRSRFLCLIKGTNRFARMLHSRVVAIHQHLRDDCHTLAANVAPYKFVVQGLLDHI